MNYLIGPSCEASNDTAIVMIVIKEIESNEPSERIERIEQIEQIERSPHTLALFASLFGNCIDR